MHFFDITYGIHNVYYLVFLATFLFLQGIFALHWMLEGCRFYDEYHWTSRTTTLFLLGLAWGMLGFINGMSIIIILS